MNKYRRDQLEKAAEVMEAIHAEIEVLGVQEQTGGDEDASPSAVALVRDQRVKGWQSRIESACNDVEDLRDEESEAAENTRGEDRRSEMEEAVSQMEDAIGDMEELYQLEQPSGFNEMWHDKHENVVSCLRAAQDA